ncbi:hypothetical protein [Brunnivagina elsteri]|uniref:hypothetical protein n=1 Tax=Brunnivagina elsteri TaxID=1247191 RepID=UPI001178A38E|nr:hypothetical protein [Calothrix elsteri]
MISCDRTPAPTVQNSGFLDESDRTPLPTGKNSRFFEYHAIAHQHQQIKTADSLISCDRTPAPTDKNSRFVDESDRTETHRFQMISRGDRKFYEQCKIKRFYV